MSGHIALFRGAFDHPVLRDGDRFRAWFWMVAEAVWKPTPFDINGKTITLHRGQFVASRARLATLWDWSPSAVERFLARLETEQMIGRETGQGRSVITIRNYGKYNPNSEGAGQATGQATGQRSDSDRTAKEQGNKGTIEEEEAKASPSSARAVSKPDPFPRPEWAEPQAWGDFLVNRKGGKGRRSYPNTATAYAKFLSDIARLSDDEWPPGRLLKHAAAKGWAGIYDPRESQNGRSNQLQLADRSIAGAASGAMARLRAVGSG